MDHVVGKIQSEFIQRKIGVLSLRGEHDIAIAIVARKRSGPVGTYREFPDLKFPRAATNVERSNCFGFCGMVPPSVVQNLSRESNGACAIHPGSCRRVGRTDRDVHVRRRGSVRRRSFFNGASP